MSKLFLIDEVPEHLRAELALFGKGGGYTPIAATRNASRVKRLDRIANDLWELRQSRRRKIIALYAAYHECLKAMPWWARPGFERCDDKGRLWGPIYALPAPRTFTLPRQGTFRILRIHESDIERDYSYPWSSDASKQRRLVEYRQLLAEQTIERREAGADKAWRLLARETDLGWAIRNAIWRMSGVAPAALAALTLLDIESDYGGKDYPHHLTWSELAALRIGLASTEGTLRRCVEECLNHKSRAGIHRRWIIPHVSPCAGQDDDVAAKRAPKSAIKPPVVIVEKTEAERDAAFRAALEDPRRSVVEQIPAARATAIAA